MRSCVLFMMLASNGITTLVLPAWSPYLDSEDALAAGGTLQVIAGFSIPALGGVTYTARVLAGPGSR